MKKFFWGMSTVTLLTLGLAACSEEDAAPATETEESAPAETTDETVATEEVAVEEVASEAEPEQGLEVEQYDYVFPIVTQEQLVLSEESKAFIKENLDVLPAMDASTIEKAKGMTDSAISAKHLNKNPQPYFTTMTTFQGSVVSVEETPSDYGNTVSLVHVLDDAMQSYQVLLLKPSGDIFEDDTVRFWGVPVGASSFENVSGGTTNVQNFAGAHIEKVQ